MRKIALWLAIAALCVNSPRFLILFLKVDGVYLDRGLEALLLAISGIATGAVLTGGGAFVAHVLATPTRGGIIRNYLVATWISLLVFNVILLAPMLVLAIRMSEFVTVMNTPAAQWLWSITAIVSVECLAGGAMAAYALLDRSHQPQPFDDFLERLAGGLHVPSHVDAPNYDHNPGPTKTRKQRQM